MGLFDNLENQAFTSLLGNNSSPLVASILHMIQTQPGGLQGLLQSFHDKGLGDLASAWVSTGPNPPVSADQIQQVLGSDKIRQLFAAATGISPDVRGSGHCPFAAHVGRHADAQRASSGTQQRPGVGVEHAEQFGARQSLVGSEVLERYSPPKRISFRLGKRAYEQQ